MKAVATKPPPNLHQPKGAHAHGSALHRDAYRLWAEGKTVQQVADTVGVHKRTIITWKKAENWEERFAAARRKAEVMLVDRQAAHLAKIAWRHRKGARKIQRQALGLLGTGAVEVDPKTGEAVKLKGGAPSYRPLLPGEVNQVSLAWAKAAEIEYGRAGGKATVNPQEHTFPDLVALLEKVNAESARSIGSGSTARALPTESDPR